MLRWPADQSTSRFHCRCLRITTTDYSNSRGRGHRGRKCCCANGLWLSFPRLPDEARENAALAELSRVRFSTRCGNSAISNPNMATMFRAPPLHKAGPGSDSRAGRERNRRATRCWSVRGPVDRVSKQPSCVDPMHPRQDKRRSEAVVLGDADQGRPQRLSARLGSAD